MKRSGASMLLSKLAPAVAAAPPNPSGAHTPNQLYCLWYIAITLTLYVIAVAVYRASRYKKKQLVADSHYPIDKHDQASTDVYIKLWTPMRLAIVKIDHILTPQDNLTVQGAAGPYKKPAVVITSRRSWRDMFISVVWQYVIIKHDQTNMYIPLPPTIKIPKSVQTTLESILEAEFDASLILKTGPDQREVNLKVIKDLSEPVWPYLRNRIFRPPITPWNRLKQCFCRICCKSPTSNTRQINNTQTNDRRPYESVNTTTSSDSDQFTSSTDTKSRNPPMPIRNIPVNKTPLRTVPVNKMRIQVRTATPRTSPSNVRKATPRPSPRPSPRAKPRNLYDARTKGAKAKLPKLVIDPELQKYNNNKYDFRNFRTLREKKARKEKQRQSQAAEPIYEIMDRKRNAKEQKEMKDLKKNTVKWESPISKFQFPVMNDTIEEIKEKTPEVEPINPKEWVPIGRTITNNIHTDSTDNRSSKEFDPLESWD